MSRIRRVIVAVATIEVLLGGLWAFLAHARSLQHDQASLDAQVTIGSTMGTAMGAFFGFGLLMMAIAARADRVPRGGVS